MTTTTVVETLRREFDEGFAKPARNLGQDVVALLAIRVAGRPYALQVSELGGTAAGTRVIPVPSPRVALLGLSGFRGMVIPVFDLAILLDEPRSNEFPRWLALSNGHDPLGFAFSELEGHLRLERTEFQPVARTDKPWVNEVIRTEMGLRPIIKLSALVEFMCQKESS